VSEFGSAARERSSSSRDVLKRSKERDSSWEGMVPSEVAAMVKKRQLFGYRDPEIPEDAAFAAVNR
jgi:hypothetical protein